MARFLKQFAVIGAAVAALGAGLAGGTVVPVSVAGAQESTAPTCAADGSVQTMTGTVSADQAKTYLLLPFEVPEGATRVEVGYSWAPSEGTTLDLGLWDASGTSGPDAFRGWGGSRQGRLDKGMPRAWVSAETADRAFTPGDIEPGTWNVELGLAEIAAEGATYTVEISCSDGPAGRETPADPVDADHVANPDPGWYRGDFHMHSWNSLPEAPDYEGTVQYGRDAQLDIMPITEYVVTRHHRELGAVQRANPDVLIWPGREVITYFGHAIVLGETPNTIEYREGFDGVTLRGIQRDTIADGALFGVAHPTVFPEAEFGSLCRGCEFQLSDDIDWDAVTTLELVTNTPVVGDVENPFIQTAIDYWQGLLDAGHRITAVSGSDDKRGPALGSTATMVYAKELSRGAVTEALEAGHTYIQVRGAADSPTVEFTGASGGAEAMMGDSLRADSVSFSATVRDGDGQTLHIIRNGAEVEAVPVVGSEFTYTWDAERGEDGGGLGTTVRIEVSDATSRTVITNPIFLVDHEPSPTTEAVSPTTEAAAPEPLGNAAGDDGSPAALIAGIAVALVALVVGGVAVGRRGRSGTSGVS